jgi:hypothetical protein
VGNAIAQLDMLVGAFQKTRDATKSIFGGSQKNEWFSFGSDIVGALVNSIGAGLDSVKQAVKKLAYTARDTFKEVMGIHSPSTVMAEQGDELPAGVGVGVDRSAGKAQAAIESMIEVPSVSSSGGGSKFSGSSGPIQIIFNISGGDAEKTKQVLESSGVLDSMTEGLERALATAGMPL